MAKKHDSKKLCFVVGPIGKADGDERIHSDWLLEGVILPVFADHFPEFLVQRADKISKAGMINTQIIEALLDAELVIADITTLNPNCFYEIGIRHMVQKPIVHMHLAGQQIPFDIAPFRSIEFARVWPKDLETAKVELRKFVSEVLDPEYKVDNPVTVARGKIEFEQSATPAQKALSDELEALRARVSQLERPTQFLAPAYIKPANLVEAFPAKPAAKFYGGSLVFEVRLIAMSVTSPRQLHTLAEKYLPKYFEDFDIYRTTEADVGVRVPDTRKNRDAARLLEVEAAHFEHPVHVVISPE